MSTELVPIQNLSSETQAVVFFDSATPQLQVKLLTLDPTYAKFIDATAERLSASNTMPKAFQGKENLPALKQVLNKAVLLGKDPSTLLDYAYVINNKVALETTLLVILFNESGKWSILKVEEEEGEHIVVEYKEKDGTSFVNKKWEGKNKRVRAYATLLSTGEEFKGPWVSMELAVKAGWYAKDNSQWKTDPDNMLRKRARNRFIKEYAPEVTAGMSSVEDIRDAAIDDQGDAKEVSKTPSLDKVVNKAASTVKKTTLPSEVLADVKGSAIEEATVVAETEVEAEQTPEEVDTETGEEFAVFFELPPFDTVSKEFKPANLSALETVQSMTTYAVLEHVKMLFASGCATERQYNSALALMEKVRGAQSETEQLEKLVQLYEWGFNNIYSKRLELYNA